MNIGRIPYLSCEPFYFEIERRGMALYDMVPSALADAVAKGEIDAGPVSLVDCFRLADHCRFLSGFCVATIRKAGSVLLHSKQPIQTLSGARIGISSEAVTSFRLLQVLLALKYQVQPAAYVTLADAHDAFLLMGNAGLRHRVDMDRKEEVMLEDALYVGMQDWADGLFHPRSSRDDVLMHPRDILEYTQGIRYFIGVPEQRAIDRFRQYLDQLNIQ